MAEKTEVDMDVFSRRISPYFTWLESRIESGWKQSESCKKDVLKETRTMATNMRAKFILGVNREDFKQELANTIELFELAIDAFPDYAGEVENKVDHFTKGIRTELGDDLLPNGFANGVEQPKVEQEVKKAKKKVKRSTKAKKGKPKAEEAEKKVKKKSAKKSAKRPKKAARKEAEQKESPVDRKPEQPPKPSVEEQPVEKRTEHKVEEKRQAAPKKPNPVVRWFRNAIFGDDLD